MNNSDKEKIKQIQQLMSELSEGAKTEFIQQISIKNNLMPSGETHDLIAKERYVDKRVCTKCGCIDVVKNGHRKDGTQRYMCKSCKHTFSITTNSIFFHTRKDISVWEKYVECMTNELSLRECAEKCDISLDTAFVWRHKILDSLQGMADTVTLNGIAEADETFFPISYKGHHNKGNFVLPRPAHKRGKDSEYEWVEIDGEWVKQEIPKKRGLSKNLVCVPCAINRDGLSIAKISNLGKVNKKAIEKVLGDRLNEDTVLCTDKEKSYRQFADESNIDLIQLDGHKVKGDIYHIQTVNSYHSRLKKFIDNFDGVATKYLNNYLIWNNILNHSKGNKTEKQRIILSWIMRYGFTEKSKDVPKRPPIPLLVE